MLNEFAEYLWHKKLIPTIFHRRCFSRKYYLNINFTQKRFLIKIIHFWTVVQPQNKQIADKLILIKLKWLKWTLISMQWNIVISMQNLFAVDRLINVMKAGYKLIYVVHSFGFIIKVYHDCLIKSNWKD